jgi:hypothetical protein
MEDKVEGESQETVGQTSLIARVLLSGFGLIALALLSHLAG